MSFLDTKLLQAIISMVLMTTFEGRHVRYILTGKKKNSAQCMGEQKCNFHQTAKANGIEIFLLSPFLLSQGYFM